MAKKIIKNIIRYFILIIFILFFIFPVFWIMSLSIKTRIQIFSIPPVWIFKPTLNNYNTLFTEYAFGRFFLNSTVAVLSSTLLALGLGTTAAYSLARFRIKGGKNIAFWILSLKIMPPITVIIPFFLLMKSWSLLDTLMSLIFSYTLFNLPVVVWLMMTFFQEIPIEIEEAAKVDGCSICDLFFKIVFPLAKNGLITTFAFCILLTWSEFLFALILTSTNAKTLPVGAITFVAARGIEWGNTTAASTIILIPLIVLMVMLQKFLVKGLTFGALKG